MHAYELGMRHSRQCAHWVARYRAWAFIGVYRGSPAVSSRTSRRAAPRLLFVGLNRASGSIDRTSSALYSSRAAIRSSTRRVNESCCTPPWPIAARIPCCRFILRACARLAGAHPPAARVSIAGVCAKTLLRTSRFSSATSLLLRCRCNVVVNRRFALPPSHRTVPLSGRDEISCSFVRAGAGVADSASHSAFFIVQYSTVHFLCNSPFSESYPVAFMLYGARVLLFARFLWDGEECTELFGTAICEQPKQRKLALHQLTPTSGSWMQRMLLESRSYAVSLPFPSSIC